jgi:hypothetical protein
MSRPWAGGRGRIHRPRSSVDRGHRTTFGARQAKPHAKSGGVEENVGPGGVDDSAGQTLEVDLVVTDGPDAPGLGADGGGRRTRR